MVYIKATITIILFLAAFILLMASPLIFINYQQKKFYKKLAKKYNLELTAKKFSLIRDFPSVKGEINKHFVFVQATYGGSVSTSPLTKKVSFSTPSTLISIQVKNKNLHELALNQIKDFPKKSMVPISDFYVYFNVVALHKDYESIIFTNEIKQKIIDYSSQTKQILNIGLKDGFLVSYSTYELITNKRYKETINKIDLMLEMVKKID